MNIRTNSARFLSDLHHLRSFGVCGTGVVRPAFSDADIAARKWLAGRVAEAGLQPEIDAIGNVFGVHPAQKSLLLGSHTDSQPEGGWLDGAFGVISALEVARASLEGNGPPVSVVSFQDEEGRFGGVGGSEVWTGARSLSDADQRVDSDGIPLGVARQAMAGMVTSQVDPARFTGFIEAHIEQGPELDLAGQSIGVVTAIVGFRQIDFVFEGRQNHAGTTMMATRRDAFQGLVTFTAAINDKLGDLVTPTTVWTVGHVLVHPNAASIVPGRVEFSVQWRDAKAELLEQMAQVIRDTAQETAVQCGLSVEAGVMAEIAPVPVDTDLRRALIDSAEERAPDRWREMPSGALHDASNVARVLPIGMLFVPSIGGISHALDEDTHKSDLLTGLEVLAGAVARLHPK